MRTKPTKNTTVRRMMKRSRKFQKEKYYLGKSKFALETMKSIFLKADSAYIFQQLVNAEFDDEIAIKKMLDFLMKKGLQKEAAQKRLTKDIQKTRTESERLLQNMEGIEESVIQHWVKAALVAVRTYMFQLEWDIKQINKTKG